MDDLTPKQAITIVEARELLRAQGVEVDRMSDEEVLAYAFRSLQGVIGGLRQLRATLSAIAQMQQAAECDDEQRLN